MELPLLCWLVKATKRFELDAAQESELLAAIAEAERGELVSAAELVGQIRSHDRLGLLSAPLLD